MPDLQKLIDVATDGTLTSDNWQYILEVTDKINYGDPEQETKDAIKIITKKLGSKDANVLLRTCLLVLALAENCGSRMKQEIATKQFCLVLLGKLSDKKVHSTVKESVASLISQLNDLFKSDLSLKPMADAYSKVKKLYANYLSTPEVPPKPAKKKEDDDLEKAIRLSENEQRQKNMKKNLVDKEKFDKQGGVNNIKAQSGDLPPKPTVESYYGTNRNSSSRQLQSSESQSAKGTLKFGNFSKVRAVYDFEAKAPEELSIKVGDVIKVIESQYEDWWKGSLPSGEVGIFPLNYVTPVIPKSARMLEQELQAENKILNGGTMNKIDRLLAMLSNPDLSQVDEDEVTRLYNELIPLRTQLMNGIDKYSERKEDLEKLVTSVNQSSKSHNQMIEDVTKKRISAFPTGGLGNYGMLSNPSPGGNGPMNPYGQLNAQPTSAGFGNSPYPQPTGSFVPQPMPQSNTGFMESGQDNFQFLNVNHFPDVNSLRQ